MVGCRLSSVSLPFVLCGCAVVCVCVCVCVCVDGWADGCRFGCRFGVCVCLHSLPFFWLPVLTPKLLTQWLPIDPLALSPGRIESKFHLSVFKMLVPGIPQFLAMSHEWLHMSHVRRGYVRWHIGRWGIVVWNRDEESWWGVYLFPPFLSRLDDWIECAVCLKEEGMW